MALDMKRIFVISICALFFMFSLISCNSSSDKGNGNIKLTLISKTDQGDWAGVERCTHYYSISGVQSIDRANFPHNEKVEIELPKTKQDYIITFWHEGVDAGGRKTPLKNAQYSFSGAKPLTVTFGCSFRGGNHYAKTTSKNSIKYVE